MEESRGSPKRGGRKRGTVAGIKVGCLITCNLNIIKHDY